MEFLEHIDQKLFLLLNSLHTPFWDQLMYWISYKYTWVPLYFGVLLYLIYKQKKKSLVSLFFLILVIVLADQISVHLFKNVFERYRPCHNLDIQGLVHLVGNHCGGQYGFVSSHAANVFAFGTLSALIIRKKYFTLGIILWASVVSYSRIYLGVHYPADILFGALLGALIAYLVYQIYPKKRF